MMNKIDIINVAGLMMSGKDDGIERELNEQLSPRSVVTIAPTPARSAMVNPRTAIARAGKEIDAVFQSLPKQAAFRKPLVVGIGRSHGGFNLLQAAACNRNRFDKFLLLIPIEAPLNPHVEVKPPALIPPLHLCHTHYKMRPELASEALENLSRLDKSKIVTIGNLNDGVVPPDAMELPGIRHIRLPDSLEPRADGPLGVLPRNYRNHLCWNQQKYQAIMQLIANLVAEALEKKP